MVELQNIHCLLKEGSRVDARVIQAESPADFWLQPLQRLPSDGPALLSDLESSIFASSTPEPSRKELRIGALYAVTPDESSQGEKWSRGRLLDLPSEIGAVLLLIDHGNRIFVPCSRLRLLQPCFQHPSPYVVRCGLCGITISDLERWTSEASLQFCDLASSIVWRVAIRERTEVTFGGRIEDTKLRVSLTRSHSSLGDDLPWADCGPFQDLDLLDLLIRKGLLSR